MPPAPTIDPNADRVDIAGNKLSDDTTDPRLQGPTSNNPTDPNANRIDISGNPLIVTSGASRSQYNENVNTLNTTKANLAASANTKQNYNFVGADGKLQTISAGSPEEALSGAQGIDPHSGVVTPTLDKGAAGDTPAQTTSQDGSGADGTSTTNSDGSTTNADGTTKNADGTVTMQDGTRVDASLASAYTNANANLDQGISQAKANLNAAAATLQNDPAAMNAINTIMSKFDQQIQLMQAKNKVLLGAARVNAARSGMLQYAPQMNDNFMSEEQDAAAQRITDLITQESQATLTAQAAYQKGDVAAFNAASAALSKAQTDKTTAIGKLLDETDKIVKERQAQQKIDQTSQKTQLSTDVTTSSKIAAGMAAALKSSGLTDPAAIKAYVAEMAQKNGITNTDILNSALVTAQAADAKANLAAENTESTIAKRNTAGSGKGTAKGGTDGAYSYSANDISSYTSFLNQGGTLPDGTAAAPRGDDTFVDPSAYIYAYKDWVKQGGTPQGFLKKFPVTNVNPASYSELPAGLQPKVKTTSTPQFQLGNGK